MKLYPIIGMSIATAITFSSCSRISTSPTHAFHHVQQDVVERSGQEISWDNDYSFNDWLEDTLQEELTIDQVVKIALLNNQLLKATYEDLGIAQAHLVQAGLLQNPIFSLSLRYENLVESASIIEMGLVQNLLDLLLKPLKKRLAYTELEIVKEEVTARVLDVIAETTIAFYTLQAANEMLDLQTQQFDAGESSYDAAKRLYAAGNINNLSLTIERANYEKKKIDLAESEVAVVDARERLNVLMGLWGCRLNWEIGKDAENIPPLVNEVADIERMAITNSIDLKMARKRIKATAISMGIEISEQVFPEMYIGPDSEKEPEGGWFIGPQFSLSIPIFDTGMAKKAEGCARLSKQWKEYCALVIDIRSAARSAMFRMTNALFRYRHFHDVVIPLEEEVTQETLHQLNAMQIGVFQLLETKQNEIDTKIRSILSFKDYWTARTEIETLLNGRMIHN